MSRKLRTTRGFDRSFRRLPAEIQRQTLSKLEVVRDDPGHRSLRVKRIKGTDRIWEMSVTMNYRVTFEVEDETAILRRFGTHDVLKRP